ncbi:MAG TPA: lipid II flippase MurJ [Patescibacteria group bacterium]|nr:lipid II flippase MurJ [Patescibacteria group bacterium]
MVNILLQKSLGVLLKRQTNILSAAFIIMSTVILSQTLGLFRERLLRSIFGASNTLGIYQFASNLPDFIFQLIIAAALSSAFIPVFSEYLTKGREEEAKKIASTLLVMGLTVFGLLSIVLAVFAPTFLQIFNLGSQFTPEQMRLMADLMRIILIGQLLFIIGSFFAALLQSYNHFFIPGIAAALYNLGIIIGIGAFSPQLGIYSAPVGMIIGGIFFVLMQIPIARHVKFSFNPTVDTFYSEGIRKIIKLMWPRTLSLLIFQLGTLSIAVLISVLSDPGRMYVIYNSAQTLAYAPVVLIGQAIAQAAFPVLSREKDKLNEYKSTFLSSFNQLLYIILPISAIILVLRIPIVRLIFGAQAFDWDATVLTGRTLALLSISIFSQALITLVIRGFYALQNTVTPLLVGICTTVVLMILAYLLGLSYGFGIEGVALALTVGSILQLLILLFLLDKKTGGFDKRVVSLSLVKFFFATLFMGFALYIPIKLLDQLVFDTTRTINLIILTGISAAAGLSLYFFLTWLFNVKEAGMFIQLFKKLGNWKEILGTSHETIEPTRVNP